MAKRTSLTKNSIGKIRKFAALLKLQGVNVSKLIVFGSYAKGKAKVDSDIDVAVISSQFGVNTMEDMLMLRRAAIQIDSYIEPVPLSPRDLDDQYSTLIQEIKQTGVSLS
jgi:predicted nucleotidyltransferase